MPYVLDTNILVSAALGSAPAKRLLAIVAERGELVVSRFILDELLEVLNTAPELRRVAALDKARVAAFVERHARLVEPTAVAWKDNPGDAAVVGIALAAGAVLVTGDKAILAATGILGVEARTLRQALDALER